MTELFLNNTKILIASNDSIKLTRENPYITSSGDYTLEVSAPLSFLENRKFFGAWNRLEKKKFTATYNARLYVNNICVLNGSAKITSSTQDVVKVQLFGDRSEFNAVFGDLYLDELALPWVNTTGYGRSSAASGTYTGGSSAGSHFGSRTYGGSSTTSGNSTSNGSSLSGGSTSGSSSSGSSESDGKAEEIPLSDEGLEKFVFVPIHDETNDNVVNNITSCRRLSGAEQACAVKTCPQYNLLYMVKCVFHSLGYTIDISAYDKEPYNRLFIANIDSIYMRGSLPHWTLKEFVEQLQYFFGCVFMFSSSSLLVKMLPAASVMSAASVCVEAEEEFSVEVSDDESVKGINTSDLHYSLSDSKYHDSDYIDNDKLAELPAKEYESFDALLKDYESMSGSSYNSANSSTLFRCPEGDYCRWIYQGLKDTDTKIDGLIHVNQFGDLTRSDKSDDTDNIIDIKIVPVAIADDISVKLLVENKSARTTRGNKYGIDTPYAIMPSTDENDVCYQIMPSLEGREITYSGSFGSRRDGEEAKETTYIQDLIEGDADTGSYEKPDRMELFFYDGSMQKPTRYEYSGQVVNINVPAAFTAYDYKNLKGISHEKWSMTLNRDVARVKTIGQLHKKYSIDQSKKYTVKILSDSIPDPSSIFIIRNRKFYCEKIEITLKDGRMDRLMTGCFYEID